VPGARRQTHFVLLARYDRLVGYDMADPPLHRLPRAAGFAATWRAAGTGVSSEGDWRRRTLQTAQQYTRSTSEQREVKPLFTTTSGDEPIARGLRIHGVHTRSGNTPGVVTKRFRASA